MRRFAFNPRSKRTWILTAAGLLPYFFMVTHTGLHKISGFPTTLEGRILFHDQFIDIRPYTFIVLGLMTMTVMLINFRWRNPVNNKFDFHNLVSLLLYCFSVLMLLISLPALFIGFDR